MEERLGRLLAMTGKVVREHFDAALGDIGSSLNTYVVLKVAALHPGMSQRELAGALGIEGPTMTHHLDRMSADGLLQRIPRPGDRRAYCVQLTPEGRAHLDRVDAFADDMDTRFRAEFTSSELSVVFDVLTRIKDRLSKEANVHHAAG
jgi:MarR family transcriptional regulator for hemolysin